MEERLTYVFTLILVRTCDGVGCTVWAQKPGDNWTGLGQFLLEFIFLHIDTLLYIIHDLFIIYICIYLIQYINIVLHLIIQNTFLCI